MKFIFPVFPNCQVPMQDFYIRGKGAHFVDDRVQRRTREDKAFHLHKLFGISYYTM